MSRGMDNIISRWKFPSSLRWVGGDAAGAGDVDEEHGVRREERNFESGDAIIGTIRTNPIRNARVGGTPHYSGEEAFSLYNG